MRVLLALVTAGALLGSPAVTWPRSVDLHALWDDRCATCHGHAGAFAREHLGLRDGVLVGRHEGRDLRAFLHVHHASARDVDAILAMLDAQVRSTARFAARCGGCHGSAAALARASLERRAGVVFVKGSDRALADFLPGHVGLSADDAAFFAAVLDRVEAEVHRP